MNRKAFIASIAALITAPFVVKAKAKQDWKAANPELLANYERATFSNCTLTEADKEWVNKRIELSYKIVVEGKDLVYVFDRNNIQRGGVQITRKATS